MSRKHIPDTIRPLFQVDPFEPIEEEPPPLNGKPEIVDRLDEAKRVVKRIEAIIEDHRDACLPLTVELGATEISCVFAALRDHARGGKGELDLASYDEIASHCLNRLFEELVEEPSNVLYTTSTGPDTTRYDAMEPAFWIECLDLVEK